MSKFRNEINLILRAMQEGDRTKEKVLYEFTYNYLKIIALKYSVNKNDYEDILVEAYLRIFKYINSADLSKDGYNWLCKIVQNVAYDFNKTYKSYVSLEDISFTYLIGDLEDRLIRKDDVLNEICKLSENEQRLIYLKFYEDMSYSEIAKLLNSKKSTIHKQVRTILKKFKNIFK